MKCRIAALFAAAAMLLTAFVFTVPASAERALEDCLANIGLFDDGLFTEAQQSELNTLIRKTSDNIDMYVGVMILNKSGVNMSDEEVISRARTKYIQMFEPNTEQDTDGAMLVLNMSSHFIHILTSGMGQMYYYNASSEDRSGQMVENLKSYLRNNDNVGAVKRFLSDLESNYKKGVPDGAYTYNEHNGEYLYVQNGELVKGDKLPFAYGKSMGMLVVVSLIVGALVALIAFAIIKSSYKLRKSLNPSNYISQKETDIYEKNDVFLRTHTTKVKIETESGGGGGGSSSSFGGHSFGGSSGHW